MVAGEVGRPRIAVETRQLIREMARANFLWGAPRIHGELLKLGITVSQATVSRYMPRSPKVRRSQAWRTFVRNHAIAIVQCRSFDGHNWARDLLSQVRSRSRIFTCRLSAFVVALATAPCAGLLGIGRSIPCCRSSPARLVFQNCNPGSQIQGAGAATPAGYSHRSFDDRSNSLPTYPTRAERSRGLLINATQLAKVCPPRAQVDATVPRLRQIAHIAKVLSAHPTLGQPRIRSYVVEADRCAADVLRKDNMVKRRGPPSQGWRTFLRNHAPGIAAMDLFVVPTIGFKLLFAFVILWLDRRDLVWINVTAHPIAEWVARQITELFPWNEAPRYIVQDRDCLYGVVVTRRLRAMGIRGHT